MGYYASGYGVINIKPHTMTDTALPLLKDQGELAGFEITIENDSIEVVYPYNKYHTEDITDVLSRITTEILGSKIIKGSVEFTGEDDSHWVMRYNPATRSWDEDNGKIVYNNDTVYVIMTYEPDTKKTALIDICTDKTTAERIRNAAQDDENIIAHIIERCITV